MPFTEGRSISVNSNRILSSAGLWLALGAIILIAACFPPLLLPLLLTSTLTVFIGSIAFVRDTFSESLLQGSRFRPSSRGPPRF